MRALILVAAMLLGLGNTEPVADECRFKTNYFSKFNFSKLQKLDNHAYTSEGVAFERIFEFGFCKASYAHDVFARYKDLTKIGSSSYTNFKGPAIKTAYTEPYGSRVVGGIGKGNVHGVALTYTSEEVCDQALNLNHTLTVVVECSDQYMEQGDAYVLKVLREKKCDPRIVVLHEAGCPDYFISDFAWWLYWKPAILAIVLLMLGCLLGSSGKKQFSIVVPVTVVVYVGIHLLWPATVFTSS
mmetsp:Transcript_24367/g.30241  ORF Transcript_24367/g.30241 Transcript_24367/m.30241 type:complete len:242 (+) Transcript_24367:14-739(+)